MSDPISDTKNHDISALLGKLESAKFSGYLELHLDRGRIVSAELRHWLTNSEFEKPLPTVEPENKTASSGKIRHTSP